MEEAKSLDLQFVTYRDEFEIPTFKSMGLNESDTKVTYLCGNSLGLMPTQTREYINLELDAWRNRGVESHFNNNLTTNWVDVDLPLLPSVADLTSSKINEVGVMGTLTMNLNSLLVSFYNPNKDKFKILFEKGAFPSDYYALYNLAKLKGFDPDEALVQLSPCDGEYSLRNEDIINYIEDNGNEIALICFSGIQYYTGQLFNIKEITNAGHKYNCIVGWDLAHAIGNIDLKLHEWDIDFAAWCSYKYLNSGPGAIGGFFINERFTKSNQPRLAGWWGNNSEVRFQMKEEFQPIPSALGFRQSNPSVLDIASLKSSLDVFDKAGGVKTLRSKSIKLTNYLESLLIKSPYYRSIEDSGTTNDPHFIIITPSNSTERGAQLSLLFKPDNSDIMIDIFNYLNKNGIICDERKPNVIRLGPTPLYNTFEDCYNCVHFLNEAFKNL